jgi:hypothetical protein
MEQVHSRLARHVHVAKNQSIGLLCEPLTGLPRVGSQRHGVTMVLKEIGEEPADWFLIIDDEDILPLDESCVIVEARVGWHELWLW